MTDASTALAADPSVAQVPEGGDIGEARSLAQDAWRALRRNVFFWIAAALIVLFVLMAAVPQLFTSIDPTSADLARSQEKPNANAWFGRDLQGYDIYARCIYGARASILVGVLTTLATGLIGMLVGIFAGFFGGWVDTVLSRLADIFFAIPLLLGGILFMSTFPNGENTSYLVVILKVVLAMAILGWPGIARLMRSSVMQVLPNDYIQAARALGASPLRIVRSHILPNAMAPVIVVSTINLGAYIATEATLSFLGIGLTYPAISWGIMLNDSLSVIRTSPHMLIFPSIFLSLAVLAFIMLGDAVRDAFDPKSR